MNAVTVRVNFYGAFKKYGDHTLLTLPAQSTVENLKQLLELHLNDRLVRDSAIACNDTIVNPLYQVQSGEIVSILPPVCGG